MSSAYAVYATSAGDQEVLMGYVDTLGTQQELIDAVTPTMSADRLALWAGIQADPPFTVAARVIPSGDKWAWRLAYGQHQYSGEPYLHDIGVGDIAVTLEDGTTDAVTLREADHALRTINQEGGLDHIEVNSSNQIVATLEDGTVTALELNG